MWWLVIGVYYGAPFDSGYAGYYGVTFGSGVAGCEGFFDSGGLKISWNWFDAAVKLKIVDFLMREAVMSGGFVDYYCGGWVDY
ncbi:hypothetical protein OIU77_002541 [Salix suchowensis]|uniref:Uncharacterized protein n=1 Tax=Salix suchowensis TaxID=1278906 RepID=A0ABQ9AYV9_9ROSI|nr:hypothetical protein OIU77_002541 [Salix suchowensis]